MKYCTLVQLYVIATVLHIALLKEPVHFHHLRALLSFLRIISVPKILSQKLLVIPNPVIRYTEVGFLSFCILGKILAMVFWVRHM